MNDIIVFGHLRVKQSGDVAYHIKGFFVELTLILYITNCHTA